MRPSTVCLVPPLLALALTLPGVARGQTPNIHGMTERFIPWIDSTDMTTGTIAFADWRAPTKTLLRLSLPRAYVASHDPIDERGHQYVLVSLVYPGLEPASIVQRRVEALYRTMPLPDYQRMAYERFSGGLFSLRLGNDYEVPALAKQRARVSACRVVPADAGMEEVLREPVDASRGEDCKELFRWQRRDLAHLYAVTVEGGERLLLACTPDGDPRRVSTNCELGFRFRGFDWEMTVAQHHVKDALDIHKQVLAFLTQHSVP